jgi:long-chain fatty acid transport protein
MGATSGLARAKSARAKFVRVGLSRLQLGLIGVGTLLSAAPLAPGVADASGLYFTDRGVRPMGRGGAFVAGADDLGAIWYNPAGIVEAGTSVLVDFTYINLNVDYQRQLQIIENDGSLQVVSSPALTGSAPFLPLPTMAGSYQINEQFTIAGGVYAPYVALPTFPETLEGQPSPARYALGSFNGSVMALPGVWLGYKLNDMFRFGVGAQALMGTVRTTITFSASPQDRLIGAPEQPEYDAAAALEIGPIFAPSLSAGMIAVIDPKVRIGISGQMATHIESEGKLQVRLPTSVAFDTARVNGDTVNVEFDFAPILRAGVEFRPDDTLRIEATWVREFWSMHDVIHVEPQGMSMDGIIGMPPSLAMPNIDIVREFQDADSFRLGVEWTTEISERQVDLRTGISYDTGAVPSEYISLSSLDFDKTILGLGGSFHVDEKLRLDVLYGHVFGADASVDPASAQIPRVNPLSGNAPLEAINGGDYSVSADLFGVGLNYSL